MNAETRSCQNCKKSFTIEPEDFNYYEKIKVPPPTWCPECRMIRRFSSANSWSLFYRNCDKCGKRTLSMYPPEQKITVYCQPCWWADDWDGSEYAMDYDPNKNFFLQLRELVEKTPHSALETEYLTLKNCDYANSMGHCKNCTLTIWADYCESVYYSSILNTLKWSADCIRGWKSELCYESISFIRGYRVLFSEECDDCVDVSFSRNCYGCTNCVGCVNLRGAKNCIFNVQYSKEEYEEKIKEMKLDTWRGIQEVNKKAQAFWLANPHREYHGHSFNLNVTGEYVYTSKNSKECYILNGAENCKWCQLITVDGSRDCVDYSGWGNVAELVYESATCGAGVSNIKFSTYCFSDCVNLEYCLWALTGKNNFGCVNLKRKNYSILNKQYSKEEYEKLRTRIIDDLQKNPLVDTLGRVWSYGEFAAPVFNRFSYNYSNAGKFFPKTKEEALRDGYSWDDTEPVSYEITLKAESIPERIQDTRETILDEVIECISCSRGYKILKGELDILKKLNLPIPHECPKCREKRRFATQNKPGLYYRKCNKCESRIYTPYKPEDPRIVYCVACYQALFA